MSAQRRVLLLQFVPKAAPKLLSVLHHVRLFHMAFVKKQRMSQLKARACYAKVESGFAP
jgi:hypothetical protein